MSFVVGSSLVEHLRAVSPVLWVCSNAVHASLQITPDVPLIGFVGRLEEQKGVDILLEALPGILDEEVQIALLGTGKKKFEKKVKVGKQECSNRQTLFLENEA